LALIGMRYICLLFMVLDYRYILRRYKKADRNS
jgi:hypothetical protein